MQLGAGAPRSRFRRSAAVVAALTGIAAGLLITFAVLRSLQSEPSPRPAVVALAGRLLPEDSGAIDELVVHFVPRLLPLLREPYRDFLSSLDQRTSLVAVVPREGTGKHSAAGRLAAFLDEIDPTGALIARTEIVQVPGPISVWSKDRALVLAPAGPEQPTRLLIPLPPDRVWTERYNDWRTLTAVAATNSDRLVVKQLPLYFDAGDFAVTGRRIIVDINLFEKNRSRGLGSPEELTELLHKLFRREVLMLGSRDGDVPRHHLSMYLTPLGRSDGKQLILLGDPRWGSKAIGPDFAPGEHSPDTGEPLRADSSEETFARYDRVERYLKGAGFRVARIPTVVFDDKTYISYTNGVYETRDGRRVAWVPHYDIPALDQPAHQRYQELGWQVHRISVRSVYPYHGTIGCLINVLARSQHSARSAFQMPGPARAQ